jgi:hypothetical protein
LAFRNSSRRVSRNRLRSSNRPTGTAPAAIAALRITV